jgi:hypothetical protein
LAALEKFLNRAGFAFDSEGILAKNLYPNEIAEVGLPIDWAMCVVLRYGMVLVAHPHDYPQTIHIFCGH